MDTQSNCEGPALAGAGPSYGHRSGAPDSHLESASGTTAHAFYSVRVRPTSLMTRMDPPLLGRGLLMRPHGRPFITPRIRPPTLHP